MKSIYIVIIMFFSSSLFSQGEYYSSDVQACIAEINERADELHDKGEKVKSYQLRFDSMENCVKGLLLKDYSFEAIDYEKVEVKHIEKPILIKVTASWCKPCIAEIPAINKIAEEYKDKIQVLVLYWDEREKVEKLKDKYSSHIKIIPSIKTSEENSQIEISGFSHYIGFPASYFVNASKEITALTRGAAAARDLPGYEVTEEEANQKNYDRIKSKVEEILNAEK